LMGVLSFHGCPQLRLHLRLMEMMDVLNLG
jgi:hypothetical protein